MKVKLSKSHDTYLSQRRLEPVSPESLPDLVFGFCTDLYLDMFDGNDASGEIRSKRAVLFFTEAREVTRSFMVPLLSLGEALEF